MSLRYLVGPVAPGRAAPWQRHRAEGLCLAFHPGEGADVRLAPGDSWDDLLARLPAGWRPDFVLLDLNYTTVPDCLWQAPVPLVALAPDWPLHWHYLRLALPFVQRTLTDSRGVDTLRKAGLGHAARANLFGLQGLFTAGPPRTAPPRDIDILFIGNLHPAVARDRLPWLARLARLSARYRVRIEQGVHGDAYRDLLLRSRVVFNRSARGEWNLRVGEACSCGALLLAERGNPEMQGVWHDGLDCVCYDEDDLEQQLTAVLDSESKRAAVAERGRLKALEHTFERHWQEAYQDIEQDWPAIRDRLARRPVADPATLLRLRVWQALSASDDGDPTLPADLDAALARGTAPGLLHLARGLLDAWQTRCREGAYTPALLYAFASRLHQAVQASPANRMAGLDLVEVLAALGQTDLAVRGARQLLATLGRPLDEETLLTPHFPAGFDFFRVEWERAAWDNAGRPAAEEQAKRAQLRWRLHALLAELTGDLVHYHEAAMARPDLPATRAALGCALARHGRFADCLPHLEAAVAADPFDAAAARALFQALCDDGQADAARRLAQERWLLQRAAPRHVAAEPWHAPPTPLTGADLLALEGDLLVRWEGPFLVQHSLGHVNRQAARELARLGCRLTLSDIPSPGPPLEPGPLLDFVLGGLGRPLARSADVCVRHAWPLDPAPPRDGRWVVFQPWEYGAIPTAWLVPLRDLADEVWVPSSFVRAGMVASGVPAGRVHVIPLGTDALVFCPEGDRLPLPTTKTFKFLFVGGTIHRKGIDVLLRAYGSTFRKGDDVCLVIKDMGTGSFYRGQTAGDTIAGFRSRPESPEVVYLDADLPEEEMAALYRACDCLVQPYRGEGFGLPIVEAMSCQVPVIVTGHGAALDYCDDSTAYLIPAQVVPFHEKCVGDIETVDFPHLAEADGHELAALLRRVVRNPREAAARAQAGRRRVLDRLTWRHTAARIVQRLEALAAQPVRRPAVEQAASLFQPGTGWQPVLRQGGRPRISLCIIARDEEANLPACLDSAAGLFDEIIVLDTGSKDRTREVARHKGAKVFDFPWVDHFAAARNACIEHASGDFIFWLDADDRLDEENREKLRQLFANLPPLNVAYSMKCRCLAAPGQEATVVDHIRLFRNDPRIRWRYRIHEQILGSLRAAGADVRFVDVLVTHTGYTDPALRGRKLQRDLRLLEMEHAEQPHDPFTLFNLGSTCSELGQLQRAEQLLQESLERSHPGDSIVRKLYVLLGTCRLSQGRPEQALQTCLKGLCVCPDDAELLFLEGVLRTRQNDLAGARAALVRLVNGSDQTQFASVVEGLRERRGRHELASVCVRLGEHAEAETLWRAILHQRPDFGPAWQGLAELFLSQRRWDDLAAATARLETLPGGDLEALLLQARAHRARGEFASGQRLLEDARARWPGHLAVLMQYSYLLLQEDRDHALADNVLAEILARDPGNAEARNNREALHRRAGPHQGANA